MWNELQCTKFVFISDVEVPCTTVLKCQWTAKAFLNMEYVGLSLKITNWNAFGRYVKEHFNPYFDREVFYSRSFITVSTLHKISTFGVLPQWKCFKSILKYNYLSLTRKKICISIFNKNLSHSLKMKNVLKEIKQNKMKICWEQ